MRMSIDQNTASFIETTEIKPGVSTVKCLVNPTNPFIRILNTNKSSQFVNK